MRGSLVPLVTPFHHGQVDEARFQQLIDPPPAAVEERRR